MYCIGQTQKKSGTAMISSGPAVSVKFLLPNSGQIKRRLGLGIGKRSNQKHGGIAMTVIMLNYSNYKYTVKHEASELALPKHLRLAC